MTMRADPSDRRVVDNIIDGFDVMAVVSLIALGAFALGKAFNLI